MISYDMRAPAFGAPARELYAAALDQVQWADALGFDSVGLGEHHGSPDGYNPSPLVLASAMGARTKRIRFRTSVVLAPLYDPIKLAEDAAVTQLATNGRLLLGIGGGYRPSEFETFGRKLEDRWRVVGETIAAAAAGVDGRAVRVAGPALLGDAAARSGAADPARRRHAPRPRAAPRGSPTAGSRRSSRKLWPPYRDECLKLGKPDPGEYPNQGPIFLWVSHEPDEGLGAPDAARAPPAALLQRVDDRGLRAPVGPVRQTDDARDGPREPRLSRAHARADARARRSSSAPTACST